MQIKLLNLQYDHLEQVRQWRMMPEVTKYMYTDPIITSKQQIAWYESIRRDSTVRYWVINVEGENIGVISLTNIDLIKNQCECAYYIAEEIFRGKGLANIIEYNIYDFVFNSLGLGKLWFEILDFNERAINLHKKFGCEVENLYKDHIFKNGEFHDAVRMAITKQKWQEVKSKLTKNYVRIEIEQISS